MHKTTIAIFFGGCSWEYSVSLASAAAVIRNLDRSLYHPILIGITREGDWLLYDGNPEDIEQDVWQKDSSNTPVAFCPGRSRPGLLTTAQEGSAFIPLDAAFPVLHGKNGEDGTLQGMLELAGIPVIGCGTLASALCMDKGRAHALAAAAGVLVPKSQTVSVFSPTQFAQGHAFARETGFPLFVKPVKSGSSYGITKVFTPGELEAAMIKAFQYDNELALEEAIDGIEVGCGILGTESLTVGEVDEIELSQGFFDFTEKYTLKTSAIHVPARILPAKAAEIKETAQTIYRALGCSGFARVDMFLTPAGDIFFNEVNTIPGFTEHSRFPAMMAAAGIPFGEVLNRIIRQAVAK